MLVAASNTRRQSAHVVKWLSISVCTGTESFPSKYMQIKWIVSRQLIASSPKSQRPEDSTHRCLIALRTPNDAGKCCRAYAIDITVVSWKWIVGRPHKYKKSLPSDERLLHVVGTLSLLSQNETITSMGSRSSGAALQFDPRVVDEY